MSEILRDLDEMMRAERMARMWRTHGRMIIFVIIVLVVGTAAQAAWKSYNSRIAREQTGKILSAAASEDPNQALVKLSKDLKGNGRAIATFEAARAFKEKGHYAEAIALYRDLLNEKRMAPELRDLAIIEMVSLEIDHGSEASAAPDQKPSALLGELEPILKSEKSGTPSAWLPRAILLAAVIKANLQGDNQGALDELAKIGGLADQKILPQAVSAQAEALKTVYAERLAIQKTGEDEGKNAAVKTEKSVEEPAAKTTTQTDKKTTHKAKGE
ncbi:MAG: tetratricopeptide repeat protein [Alphaproteobacteria bacterium]|nr:tetratricopeptide repeat protein [Alphaproteobacteria bacterium]